MASCTQLIKDAPFSPLNCLLLRSILLSAYRRDNFLVVEWTHGPCNLVWLEQLDFGLARTYADLLKYVYPFGKEYVLICVCTVWCTVHNVFLHKQISLFFFLF